jgi:hypothetical protein
MPVSPLGTNAARPAGFTVQTQSALPAAEERRPQGAASAFVDLGKGVSLRVGGRVRLDAVSRH